MSEFTFLVSGLAIFLHVILIYIHLPRLLYNSRKWSRAGDPLVVDLKKQKLRKDGTILLIFVFLILIVGVIIIRIIIPPFRLYDKLLVFTHIILILSTLTQSKKYTVMYKDSFFDGKIFRKYEDLISIVAIESSDNKNIGLELKYREKTGRLFSEPREGKISCQIILRSEDLIKVVDAVILINPIVKVFSAKCKTPEELKEELIKDYNNIKVKIRNISKHNEYKKYLVDNYHNKILVNYMITHLKFFTYDEIKEMYPINEEWINER